MDQEQFAQKIREAGIAVGKAEYELSKADADEKRIVAQTMVVAEAQGAKTNAAQLRASDEDCNVYEARLSRGRAKGMLAAAKSESSRRTWSNWFDSLTLAPTSSPIV